MKTTTLPANCLPGALAPARPIVPRPLWERQDLFQEPAFAEHLAFEDGDEDDSE